MLEVLTVVVVVAIVTGIAATIMTSVMPTVHADSALEMVVADLNQARQRATDQRRNFLVTFAGTNEIKVQREELDGTLTTISDYFLPNDMTYTLVTGVPDTPDGFGNSLAVNFAGSNTLTFVSDGTSVDNQGRLVDGTVFMAMGSSPTTARAVTVMGATSQVKGYRYNGTQWN